MHINVQVIVNAKTLELVLMVQVLFLALLVPANARTVVDQTGAEMEIEGNPGRVISLAPSITEMVFSLQAEDQLVAATRFSNYPAAAENLPRIGSYVQLDLEKIVAIKPDLCLAIKDGNPRRSIDVLKSLGIPVFAIDPRNIDEILEAFLLIGNILGVPERSEKLVSELKNRLALVEKKVATVVHTPGVFFQIADTPIVSAGKDSYIDKVIMLAGGRNLAGEMQGYPKFSWENILTMQPEVILISSMAGEKQPEALKSSWQQWTDIPAVKNRQIHVVDADLFNRPTARLISGLELLVDILHPELSGVPGVE